MRMITRSMAAAGFGVLMAASAIVPAEAMPMPSLSTSGPSLPEQSDVIQVHDHGHSGHWHNHNHWSGGHKRHGSDSYYDDDSDSGVLFKRLITGTLFDNERVEGYSDGRAQACASRYQSYRASDNSYQPSHGPRRECR